MFKKIISVFLIAMLLIGSSVISFADRTEDEIQAELKAIQEEKAALQQTLNSGTAVENSLLKEVRALDANIATLNLEIKELNITIELTEERVNKAIVELDAVEQDINKQQEDLGDRLAAMYMNGSVGFIDVILGSNSMSDLMTNLDRIQMVYDADKEMLKELEIQQKILNAQKEYLESLKADLEVAKADAAAKEVELESERAVVAEKKAAIEADNDALQAQIDAFNAEANRLTAEILKLQGNEAFVGGAFTWPAPGYSRITSPFKQRTNPITGKWEQHLGMDIGVPSNSTIVAANSGTVIKAGWNNSYGWMVMIDHGGGIVTLYAHNNKLLVSTGDIVYKGQAISLSGSSGDSTGPHLHFEVRVNGKVTNPADYVSYGM